MKKSIFKISFFLLFVVNTTFSQVGIGTVTPTSTLDVVATYPTGTINPLITDGLLLPRITRERAQSMTATPTSTMIYITEVVTGSASGTTINVTSTGIYFYNGSVWEKIVTGVPNSVSFFTTGGVSIAAATGLTYAAGFPQTVTIPSNCNVLISADIGVQTTSALTSGFSMVDVVLIVDGVTLTDGGYQRTATVNNTGVTGTMQYASMSKR